MCTQVFSDIPDSLLHEGAAQGADTWLHGLFVILTDSRRAVDQVFGWRHQLALSHVMIEMLVCEMDGNARNLA